MNANDIAEKAPVTVLPLSGQNTMPLETKYHRRAKRSVPAHLITAQVSAVSQKQNLIRYLWSCSLQMFAYRGEKQHMLFLWLHSRHNNVFFSSAVHAQGFKYSNPSQSFASKMNIKSKSHHVHSITWFLYI